MISFFTTFADWLFRIGFKLQTTNLFQVANPFGNGYLNISILDLLIGFVVMSMIISVFWKGAKG